MSDDDFGGLHRLVAARLGEAGQLYTGNRRRLIELLADAGPSTLPELLTAGNGLAQSSAYRNLTILAEVGVVRRLVHGGDHARWELAEELTGHHHHLVCDLCGTVVDVELPVEVESLMDRAFDAVAAAAGFEVDHHNVDILGRCADCRVTGN
ncbi:MAG: Fur family transcriptional regulator [Ilumatobacteraceae bacterium]